MRFWCVLAVAVTVAMGAHGDPSVRITTFQFDVTPPIGAPLCGSAVNPAKDITDPLTARGIAILPDGQQPIVLCAVDWVGIANESHDAWRKALADAADTSIDRVAVHVLHQHDAPFCDLSTEALAAPLGLGGKMFDVAFSKQCIERAGEAMAEAMAHTTPVTHVGVGRAKVDRVAANRRIIGEDGKVKYTRWTATADPKVRACATGEFDPYLRCISLWNEDTPVAVLTYYATHPQSHYGQGHVSADFPGMARALFEANVPGAAVLHFDGAGGNVSAGKYNNGAPENRPVLARRLYDGMKLAWQFTAKTPLSAQDVNWYVEPVALPLRPEVGYDYEAGRLHDDTVKDGERLQAAGEVAWIDRCKSGHKIDIGLLKMGPARVLHMPGELFVEYQLAAQAMAPEDFIAMAAYGDYGPGYIGTRIAYTQGGYEDAIYTSRTAPDVEDVLMGAMQTLIAASN